MAGYNPPPLNRRIVLRNPSSAQVERNKYGGAVGAPVYREQWELWAHRQDVGAHLQHEEGLEADILRSRFTIRYRDGLDPEGVEIVDAGAVFASVGPPLERGMRGNRASHLQIVCERRA